MEKPHHNNQPSVYIEVTRRAASTGDWSQYCGHTADPIRLDRSPDGRIDIIDGRHRIWSALRVGTSIPVQIVGRSGR